MAESDGRKYADANNEPVDVSASDASFVHEVLPERPEVYTVSKMMDSLNNSLKSMGGSVELKRRGGDGWMHKT